MQKHPFSKAAPLWNVVFILTMLVYAVGLFVDIMEPDAAVYAQVSMEMHDRGDYLSIYHKGQDWLDKPHFPFWMSAFSYQLFGVNTFAYKFPAVLFVLLGACYTFLFTRKFYSALHGWVAVLIFITAQHIIISNQDVRAEPFMTGLVIMALYHMACFIEWRKKNLLQAGTSHGKEWIHALAGALALACLIMTKGLFTIIPVGAGIGLSLLYNRNWKQILDWRWLAIGVFIVLFMSPALYGYYRQFDLHPEKTVFGKQGVSGVEFFMWTSQWGRFTNTGPIKGKGDISFFIHTLIWAFLPWAFAAFFALYRKTRQLIRKVNTGENYTYFGFITLFLIFSASSFQLSFYLNPLFPLLSIITAVALLEAGKKALKTFSVIHTVLCSLLAVALVLLHVFFMSRWPHADSILILLAGFAIAYSIFIRKGAYLKKILFATALVCVSVSYYLNRDFYPALLEYQAESQVAHYIHQHKIPVEAVVFLDDMESVSDVILHKTIPVIYEAEVNDVAGKYVFTTAEGKGKIKALGLSFDELEIFEDFPVTRLTGKFINKATRQNEIELKYLIKVQEAGAIKPLIEISYWKAPH